MGCLYLSVRTFTDNESHALRLVTIVSKVRAQFLSCSHTISRAAICLFLLVDLDYRGVIVNMQLKNLVPNIGKYLFIMVLTTCFNLASYFFGNHSFYFIIILLIVICYHICSL